MLEKTFLFYCLNDLVAYNGVNQTCIVHKTIEHNLFIRNETSNVCRMSPTRVAGPDDRQTRNQTVISTNSIRRVRLFFYSYFRV